VTEPVSAVEGGPQRPSAPGVPLHIVLLLPLLFAVQGCGGGGPEYVDAEARLEQVERVIHTFAVANEWHYSEHGAYTADASRFREGIVWPPFRDSVELRVTEMNDDGWAAVATHVALGDDVGCTFRWGETEETVRTPGGVPFSGGQPDPLRRGIGRRPELQQPPRHDSGGGARPIAFFGRSNPVPVGRRTPDRARRMSRFGRGCTAPALACAGALLLAGCGDAGEDGPRPADLWLLDAEGVPVRALTTHPAADEEPEFSRDGRLVLFDSDRGGSNDLFALERGSGTVDQLTFGPAKIDHGAWSPDGQWIAYQHDAGDNTDVWMMRNDGSERTRLTTNPARGGWPDWSADG